MVDKLDTDRSSQPPYNQYSYESLDSDDDRPSPAISNSSSDVSQKEPSDNSLQHRPLTFEDEDPKTMKGLYHLCLSFKISLFLLVLIAFIHFLQKLVPLILTDLLSMRLLVLASFVCNFLY